EAVLETPGLLRVGSIIRQRTEVQGRMMLARLHVDELEPYHRLVLALEVQNRSAVDVLEVTPLGAGSRVRYGGCHVLAPLLRVLCGWRLGSPPRRVGRPRAAGPERPRRLVRPAP